MGSRIRRWLNQSTHSRVANSTGSRPRQGPRVRITSVLYSPMMDSARALSYESPTLPTDGSMAGLGQAFGVADGQGLRPAVAVVDQGVARVHHARVQGLFERVERQVGAKRVRHPPAHDAPRVGVDDERDVDEPRPGRDVGQVREPQRVGARSLEHPVDPVRRAPLRRHAGRCLHCTPPHHTAKAKLSHPPCNRAPGHRDALAAKLTPHLADPVHPEVLFPHPADLLAKLRVAACTGRQPAAVPFPGFALVVRRRGNRPLPAERLDPVFTAVGVNERRHVLGRRSSSA